MSFNQEQLYIDKTGELQKGIEGFPFVYIEGSAACGKSTAVQMLLAKYPDTMHVIFVGREHPDECLLPLLWKRQMEIIPQEALLFSRSEIQKLITEMKCNLSAAEVYEETGGWAGCVDVMLRLACRLEKYSQEKLTVAELRRSYEVEGYIQSTIMSALGEKESDFLQRGLYCPFVNEKLCEEVLGISDAFVILQKLRRKGILQYDGYRKCWKIVKVFRPRMTKPDVQFFKELASWYAKEGYVQEAICCIRNTQDDESYMAYLQTYYNKVEPLDIPGELVLSKRKNSPEMCYLQGMYNYLHQDFLGLDREIVRLEKMETVDIYKKYEILLNLYYLKADFTMESWMKLLVKYGEIFGDGQRKLHHPPLLPLDKRFSSDGTLASLFREYYPCGH